MGKPKEIVKGEPVLICFLMNGPMDHIGDAWGCEWLTARHVMQHRLLVCAPCGDTNRPAPVRTAGRTPPGKPRCSPLLRAAPTPRSIMNFFLETLQVLLLSLWYNVEAFIYLFVPMKKKNIAGEVVLITGSGSGIGRLMAQEFASLGTVLVLWDINQEGLKETAKLAKQSGASRVHSYLCDCSDKNEVYRVADQVKREVGDISILVNNAGIVTGKKFMDAPDSLIEKTVEVNTMAHFWTYKAFLPAMIANNHGHLVSIASSAGLIGVNGLADYCASKFAAVGFAESVGLELLATGKDGVKTTIVCPYFINTGMFDGCQTKWPRLLPILKPDYVAKKIIDAVLTDQVFLLMPRSMYLIAALKSVLPMKQGILLGQYLGAFNLMDTFKGRSRKQE